MTTAVLEKETRIHLIIYLYLMVFIALFLLVIIRQPDQLKLDIKTEMEYTVKYMSVLEYADLQSRINNRYQSWLHDSNIYAGVYKALAPTRQKKYAEEWQENSSAGFVSNVTMHRIIDNFELYFYQITHRITLMEYWMLLMLPLMIAIIFTGYYRWRIKLYQLIGQSTSLVRIWLKVMWLMLSLFLVYLITPNLFGPYSVFAPPVLLLVMALSVSFIISSFTKTP